MKYILSVCLAVLIQTTVWAEPVHVGPLNFVRAETDNYMANLLKNGSLGTLKHGRKTVPLDRQTVIRMNLDTLYSTGVFDLSASPVTITLPDNTDGRYMSAEVLSQDHLTPLVFRTGSRTVTQEDVGTRYAVVIIRTFVDATDPADIAKANGYQDLVQVEQADKGSFEVPEYDQASLEATRRPLLQLGALSQGNLGTKMGWKGEVNPIGHLIVTAAGWGLLPEREAVYFSSAPKKGDEQKVHILDVRDMPENAFWSVTVYNQRGFMEPNELGINAFNNVTGTPDADGGYRVQFGGCDGQVPNCIPVMENWNYLLRVYAPGAEVLDGTWAAPKAKPVG